jgi:hypothetical protein
MNLVWEILYGNVQQGPENTGSVGSSPGALTDGKPEVTMMERVRDRAVYEIPRPLKEYLNKMRMQGAGGSCL